MKFDKESFIAANALVDLEPVFASLIVNAQHLPKDYGRLQMQTLILLSDVGALTITEIAEHHLVSKQHMSQIIPHMEEHGLVFKFQKENNKKNIYVDITDKGKKTIEDYVVATSETISRMLECMDTIEKEEITLCCRKLKNLLSKADNKSNMLKNSKAYE